MSKTGKRYPRQMAITVIGPFFRYMEGHRGIGSVHFAGAIRRNKDSIGDIDITATLNGRVFIDKIWEDFATDQGLTYLKYGDFERTVFLGHNVEIRFFRPEEVGAALLFTTGSSDFNIAMRALAKKKNMLLNRYGLWTRDKSRKLIAAKSEHEIFKALHLSYVPPEEREHTGRIWEEYRRV